MRTTLIVSTVLFLIAVLGAEIVSPHRSNATLRAHVDEQRRLRETRTVKTEPSAAVMATRADEGGRPTAGTRETSDRVMQLRAEVAVLEKEAAQHYAANQEETDAPSSSRDPEKGMTKLENLQNVGQRTPAAALQTFFWAVMKGNDQMMARTLTWNEAVRPRAQALIDRLPEEMRACYSTPEHLAALLFSKYAMDVSAIHIAETVSTDAANASLTVKGLTGGDEHLPMHLGPNGWQLLCGEGELSMLNEALAGKKTGK